MRISQLRDYLDTLIASGVDPNTPVCIHDEDPAQTGMEVSDAVLLEGPFREDPSPKMCGYLQAEGKFLLLSTCIDYDPMLNSTPRRYQVVETGVEAPAKSWPNGHWYDEPRRKPGQP